jgi:hypothetical protein
MDLSKLTGLAGKMQHSTLTLLLWDQAVDAVLIEQSILGPSIRLMERFPRDETVYETVAARLAGHEIMPSRVVICLPRCEAVMRTIRYPAIVQNDLAQMVPFEATRHLPFPEDGRSLGFAFALTEDEKELDVHLLAARKADVSRVCDAMQAAGLPVDAVLVFSSLVAAGIGTAPSMLVVADAGHVELSLICNGLICDSMCLPRAGGPPLSTTVERMIASNRSVLGLAGVGRLITAGPLPLDKEQTEALSVTLGIEAERFAVPESISAVLGEVDTEPLIEGLQAVAAVSPPSLNLIESTRRSIPVSSRTKWMLGLAALLLIELIAGWTLWTRAPAGARAGVEKDLAALRRQAAPAQKLKDQNRMMRSELTQLHDLVNTRVSVMEIFKTLSDTFPEDTYLTALSYERGGQMRIRGRSKEPDKLPALLLMDVPFISSIEASDIDEKRGEYHSFSMTVALKGAENE